MEIGSILLILALALIVGIFISRPFFEETPAREKNAGQEEFDHERSSLLAERDRILNALKELDFDHLLGKIPEEEYPQQRAILMQKGVDVLKRLDALQSVQSSHSPSDQLELALEHQTITQPLFQGNNKGNGQSASAKTSNGNARRPDDEIERMLANRRRVRTEKAAGFCSKCGNPIQKSDRFCPKCGYKTA